MSNITLRDKRTERRFFVDNIIVDHYGKQLGAFGLAVYMVLVRHAKPDGTDSFPSHSTIADKLGCSMGTVKSALRDLSTMRLIEIVPRYRDDGGRTSNEYWILDPPSSPRDEGVVTTDTHPPVSQVPTINPQEEESTTTTTTPTVVVPVSVGNGSSKVARALRATLTRGENDPVPKSTLATYVEQQMNSPVPSGQLNKLAMGYTEILPGGRKMKHPSPDQLFETDPLFSEYVDQRIAYYQGASGSPATKRAKLINALCSYKGSTYSWLEWRKERESGSRDQEAHGTKGSREEDSYLEQLRRRGFA